MNLGPFHEDVMSHVGTHTEVSQANREYGAIALDSTSEQRF